MHRLRSSQYFLKSADTIVFKYYSGIRMLIKSVSKLSKRCFLQNAIIGNSYKHSPCMGIINNRTTLSNSHNRYLSQRKINPVTHGFIVILWFNSFEATSIKKS